MRTRSSEQNGIETVTVNITGGSTKIELTMALLFEF